MPANSTHGRRQTCVICGEEMRLPALVAAGLGPVCGSAHCRVLAGRRSGMGEQAFQQLVAIRLRQRRERREFDARMALRLAGRRETEARENQALWDAAENPSNGGQQKGYSRVVLPSGPRSLSPLPQRRRNLHRDHLNRIIAGAAPRAAALAALLEDLPKESAAVPVTGALCGLCRGGCCTRGNYKAFLSEATILRFMSRNRTLRPRDVLAAYLDRLGSRTETNSCVHHGANGCTLPREMRSDVCNDYHCESIAKWRDQRAAGTTAPGTLVIVRRLDAWSKNEPDAANEIIGLHLLSEQGDKELPLEDGRGIDN